MQRRHDPKQHLVRHPQIYFRKKRLFILMERYR